jgi:hypothetical protein
MTGGALYKQFQRGIKPNTKLILEALERGEDPLETVSIGGDGKAKGQDSNLRAASHHVFLMSQKNSSPMLISCSLTLLLEISSIMGGDTTSKGIRFQIDDRFKPIAKRQLEMKQNGLDPKDIDLDSIKKSNKKGQTALQRLFTECFLHSPFSLCQLQNHSDHNINHSVEIAKHFGSDATSGGIGFQFRAIKADAKRQRDCVENGGDPVDLGIGGKG